MDALAALSILALMAQVHAQCISENDMYVLEAQPNLTSATPFSTLLFKEVLPSSGNFFFSPFSIWMALVLSYFGSRGKTEAQLEAVLALDAKVDALAMYKALTQLYQASASEEYTISTANRIYVDASLPLRKCLKNVLSDEVQNINFAQPDEAAASINKFVNTATRGKIPDFLHSSDVTGSEMALVNAVYFKGFWKQKFKLEDTKKEMFFASPDELVFVDMMGQIGTHRYGESKELNTQVLEMRYEGDGASMFVYLPKGKKTGQELDEMLKKMTPELLLTSMRHDELKEDKVHVKMPKFKLETTLKRTLKTALIHMGLHDLFSLKADLTGFSPAGGLRLTNSIHRAVLEVTEEGTEAVAATVLKGGRTARRTRPFTCDRPFFFLIRDNSRGNILFMGVYRKPSTAVLSVM
ncbi:leukocyte elastase inhibitor A-like [Penaeus japonicus]|uniref:leukocyte elastase inhibitor A-like n=1 Tax=Penaeus japonicus TaxID=27405 RepID=UPI001C70EFF1|nr:leukocyte elastase inhibitor A-like [Penaeus japonicus]